MIFDQLDPSAHAPWTSTTLTSFERILAPSRKPEFESSSESVARLERAHTRRSGLSRSIEGH